MTAQGNEITDESHIANINPSDTTATTTIPGSVSTTAVQGITIPVFCRWINADGYASTGQGLLGCNMYTYCGNNPVNYIDSDGEFPVAIGAGSRK